MSDSLPSTEHFHNNNAFPADAHQTFPFDPQLSISMFDSSPSSLVPPLTYDNQLALEHQFKLTQLQQLQQLQSQIFQQQIALIGGQLVSPDVLGDTQRFSGLLTPGPSAEIRPQKQPLDLMSEYEGNGYRDPPDHYASPMLDQIPQDYAPQSCASVPEHIGVSDLDISPLTSPWLGAHYQLSSHVSVPSGGSSNKRMATSADDDDIVRKKQTSAIRPTTSSARRQRQGSKSLTSTPLLRTSRSQVAAGSHPHGDVLSPVDFTMPPPAMAPSASASSSPGSLSPGFGTQMTPVTPASIMNIGRMGINTLLLSHPKSSGEREMELASQSKPRAARQGQGKKTQLHSPNLKAILSAGPSLAPAETASPVVQVRKTSHKAAEQKRRDSLKSKYDDLRGLLPPIPLASTSDERSEERVVLPGALPPRGPPKAGGEGPNKGVSKLQLLICGNEYIRLLKSRVERRDEEMARLRREVRVLRGEVGVDGRDWVRCDLDRDVDEGENIMLTRQDIFEDAEDDGED